MRAQPGIVAGRARCARIASLSLALCAALALAATPAQAQAQGQATASAPPPSAQSGATPALVDVSDLRGVSHWAYPTYEAPVRAKPSARARVLGALRLLTVDGQAALYVALDSERLASGTTWMRVELPGRPNGRTGWVPRGALGSLHAVGEHLRVDRGSLRVTLLRGSQELLSAPIGVGKASTVTPSGNFYVMEKLTTFGAPLYGPYALGTSAYAPTLSEWPGGGVVGIHGTNEPQLIPGRPSHGCIRMRNADISRLWRMVGLGTPIEIV
jgi:hypothetical protein